MDANVYVDKHPDWFSHLGNVHEYYWLSYEPISD